jgi:prophage regulatory protein
MFLRLPEVIARTGLFLTSIYEQVNNGLFPTPVGIGKRAVAWREDELAT